MSSLIRSYHCPICGTSNLVNEAEIHRELNICTSCSSNSRFRATVLSLLSAFSEPLTACNLSHASGDKQIRGVGFSDSLCYAELLSQKFSYTNTYLHSEPILDIEKRSSFLKYKPIHFIVCNDILEHTLMPPAEVISVLYEALEPGGVLILCAPTYHISHHVEKYPSIKDYKAIALEDGSFAIEVTPILGPSFIDNNPCFHGGPGRVLETRIISEENLRFNLKSVGFYISQLPESLMVKYGAWWPEAVERKDVPSSSASKPFICRKRE